MPELPDVEIFRRFLLRHAAGKTILSASCRDPLVVGTLGRRTLDRVLPGRQFHSTRRHGKYLFARAESAVSVSDDREVWVVFHFGMSGSLEWTEPGTPELLYTRALFRFRCGVLAFVDPRRFGRVAWVTAPEQVIESKHLGPDPLSPGFGRDGLRQALGHRAGAIKALLLDQSAVAGVGNLYADEALFQAGIHPRALANALSSVEWRRLSASLDRVLKKAIANGLAGNRSPRGWLLPHRESGRPCPRCGALLSHTVVGGRTTYFCPRHQRRSASDARGARRGTNIASP